MPEQSPFADLQDLLRAAAEKPDTIVFAVGIGAPSHFTGLMLENAFPDGEARFRFTQSGGGAKRFASLLGGHSAVSTFSVAEFVEFRAGGLRALAILSDERHAEVPDVLTAREQGIETSSTNMHFWWAPKGTPSKRIERLADVLESTMQLPEVMGVLADMATEPVFVRGDQLVEELAEREQEIAAVSQRDAARVPDFGLATLAACGILGVGIFARGKQERRVDPTVSAVGVDVLSQRLVAAFVVGYVLALQFLRIDYRIATCVFGILVGFCLSREKKNLWPIVMVWSLMLSVGLHFVFTRVLVVDLP